VYLIHRRDQLRASKLLQERLFANPKIEVIWNKQVLELVGGPTGLTRLELHDTVTGERSALAATGCFIFIGFKPNSWLIKDHAAHDSSGYLITDDRMMTSITPACSPPAIFEYSSPDRSPRRLVTPPTAAIAVEKFLTDRKTRAERKTEVGV
jgi:thioredoxin reductase (NADPH)